jgi:hypothetical protein
MKKIKKQSVSHIKSILKIRAVLDEMKNPAAVALGKMKSAAKSKAARENGKLGGRPRKLKRVARRANAAR